jgi:TPR repeat protein
MCLSSRSQQLNLLKADQLLLLSSHKCGLQCGNSSIEFAEERPVVPIDPSTAFVSYSREDSEFALRLTKDLKEKGANVWMDKLDIRAGQFWDAEVEDAVRNCSRMLVILSPASVASHQVTNEFMAAISKGKPVIPILFQECEIPIQLQRVQYANFGTAYDTGMAELLVSLGVEVKETGAAPAMPSGSAPAITPQDKLHQLNLLAESGEASAMVELGDAYDQGRLTAKNPFLAADWYHKAAKVGDASAMYKLGQCYYKGEGVKSDKAEAVNWYQQAAERKDPDGMYCLGFVYEYGVVVNRNLDEAEKWYLLASRERPQAVQEALKRIDSTRTKEGEHSQVIFTGIFAFALFLILVWLWVLNSK